MEKFLRYRVRVEAVIERVKMGGVEWKQLSADDPKFGYTPQVECIDEDLVQIYDQTVPELDMAALVKVVNRIQ